MTHNFEHPESDSHFESYLVGAEPSSNPAEYPDEGYLMINIEGTHVKVDIRSLYEREVLRQEDSTDIGGYNEVIAYGDHFKVHAVSRGYGHPGVLFVEGPNEDTRVLFVLNMQPYEQDSKGRKNYVSMKSEKKAVDRPTKIAL